MGKPVWEGSLEMRRARVLVVAGLLGAAISGFDAAPAQTPQCSKADFEAVVDEAAGALRDLARQNTPAFQGKLRQLKGKRGWSDDQLVKEAEPLVRDDKIAGFDQQSEEFLLRITSGGQAGSSGGAPDCKLLAELRAVMQSLVETQKAKWAYMFEKIEGELRK
jgi:hypothetical protein